MIDNKKNGVSVNPVMCIVFASFVCNVLLNILIYKKRRKNEKEDKGKKVELVSKELNHLAAILHVYAGVWIL